MKHSLQCLWRASFLLFLGQSIIHSGEARVLTEVPSGPLYRVRNYPLSISCNVSGFSNPTAQQDFEFSIYKSARPTMPIQIISTKDPDYAYAAFSSRVNNKDITVERVSPTSVLFKMNNLKDDEGEFECHVVNPESTYDGIYVGRTTVKVIDNSLTVSTPDTTPLSHNVGEAITLTCRASSNTFQHTHLSVTWSLLRDGEDHARPIISLDKDFTLSPGLGFEERYRSGLIGLEKVGEATYKLKMTQLEPSDQGNIYCEAQEWIQDPDRSWYAIAKEVTGAIALKVKPIENKLSVLKEDVALNVTASQKFNVSCVITSRSSQSSAFQVTWFWQKETWSEKLPIYTSYRNSTLQDRSDKRERLRFDHPAPDRFDLTILGSVAADSGLYLCEVEEWLLSSSHGWRKGAVETSGEVTVTVYAGGVVAAVSSHWSSFVCWWSSAC